MMIHTLFLDLHVARDILLPRFLGIIQLTRISRRLQIAGTSRCITLGARTLPPSLVTCSPSSRHVSTSNADYFPAVPSSSPRFKRDDYRRSAPQGSRDGQERIRKFAPREARAAVFNPAEAREKAVENTWN
jgi:hypothetical protein